MQNETLTLVCVSHLRWDHVWQRPQQLMSRFTQYCRVLYVNPPEITGNATEPYFQEPFSDHGVQVMRPIFPATLLDTAGQTYRDMWLSLMPALIDHAGPNMIFWVFSPLADYLASAAQPYAQRIVYDCMDDLASFKDGTPEMRQREKRLFNLADVVFTGGRSMYEARKDQHPNVHCFPSGVDLEHYRQAQQPTAIELPAIASIPHPRLGYFGVLDERIDWPLIASIAEERPDWHWTLVGPTAKVDPAELPSAPNIHYLGQQNYADLPCFLGSFDLATMPFALNEATRFISPTKTPEYLAGGKDVISTSVPDVVAAYQGIVTIVDGVDAWIDAIEQLLAAPPADRLVRLERAQPLLERGSWDGIVERMWTMMHRSLERAVNG